VSYHNVSRVFKSLETIYMISKSYQVFTGFFSGGVIAPALSATLGST